MLKLNSLHLKLLATLFMVIDHIACFLISPLHEIYIPMRLIGRLAAPLFWFCFTQGFQHTSHKLKYIVRLGIAAFLMGCGNFLIARHFDMPIDVTAMNPNIFATMFLMALAIHGIDLMKTKPTAAKAIAGFILTGICSICVILFAEYGWIAFVSIICLCFIRDNRWKYGLFIVLSLTICYLQWNILQMFMVFAVPLMFLSTSEKPKHSLKWFFYVFYPVHLWLLMILSA